MFQGASSLSLDAKGRLSVPTRYRDELNTLADGQLTITRHPHGYLMLYARPEWEKTRERIAALPMDAQWWKRILLSNAMDVAIDRTGRILIAPELRAATGITREVMLFGLGNHFELWDKAEYQAQEAQFRQAPMPPVIQAFSF